MGVVVLEVGVSQGLTRRGLTRRGLTRTLVNLAALEIFKAQFFGSNPGLSLNKTYRVN